MRYVEGFRLPSITSASRGAGSSSGPAIWILRKFLFVNWGYVESVQFYVFLKRTTLIQKRTALISETHHAQHPYAVTF